VPPQPVSGKTSERWSSGFVCDLSGLVYSGGDRLLGWRHNLRDGIPDALVVSNSNRARVESLIDDEDELSLLARVYASVDEAMHALCAGARRHSSD
jgi:hypothetical protein